jgi:hypothetical protein
VEKTGSALQRFFHQQLNDIGFVSDAHLQASSEMSQLEQHLVAAFQQLLRHRS